jgi:hypothetical protein
MTLLILVPYCFIKLLVTNDLANNYYHEADGVDIDAPEGLRLLTDSDALSPSTKKSKPKKKEPKKVKLTHSVDVAEPPKLKATRDGPNASKDDKYIVLLTCSIGYYDMWLNWLKFFKRLSIPDLPVHLFAEDNATYFKCLELVKNEKEDGAVVTCLPWDFAFPHTTIPEQIDAQHLYSRGYKEMVSHRPSIIQKELELGHHIIFSDTDVIWKKNPLPYIMNEMSSPFNDGGDDKVVHFLAQDERNGQAARGIVTPGKNEVSRLCAGFMIYRSCPEVLALVDVWKQHLIENIGHDQTPLNELIENTDGINAKPLPRKLFVNGQLYFKRNLSKEDRENAMVVHGNYILGHGDKIEEFKKWGLWALE